MYGYHHSYYSSVEIQAKYPYGLNTATSLILSRNEYRATYSIMKQ